MNFADARIIADDLRNRIEPACVPGKTEIVGSVRRRRMDVGDIEILGMPILRAPRPEFGRPIFQTMLDQLLYQLVIGGYLFQPIQNGDRKKKFPINLNTYNFKSLNPFYLELYLVLPPAQWGVLSVIRTGPNKDDDAFSQWVVTNRIKGGALPDGYAVKHGAVWNENQLDARREPLPGQVSPFQFPDELSFFEFLEIGYIEPQARHAHWRRVDVRES